LTPRVRETGVVQDLGVGQGVEKRDEIGLLIGRQRRSADVGLRLGLSWPTPAYGPEGDRPAAGGLVLEHLSERGDAAVVHVRSGHGDVPECRCLESADVFRPFGDLVEPEIVGGEGKLPGEVVQARIVKRRGALAASLGWRA